MPGTLYKCLVCGEIFATEKEAEDCEAFHVNLTEIVDVSYREKCTGMGQYPEKIKVRMSDGKELLYKRISS